MEMELQVMDDVLEHRITEHYFARSSHPPDLQHVTS
jgi:hypothetical protein